MAQSAIVLNGAVGLPSARQMAAAAGKMFVCTNPIPGTAIAYANKTGYHATANGLFSVSNGNPVGGALIQFDRLKLIQTATAPGAGLVTRFELLTQSTVMPLTGTALAVTPQNVNGAFASSTGATVTFFSAGAGTVGASAGTRRLIGVGSLASGVNVQHDSWTFDFGDDGLPVSNGVLGAARATAPADLVAHCTPVTVAPGWTAWMNLWGVAPDTAVPSYEFNFTYIEL